MLDSDCLSTKASYNSSNRCNPGSPLLIRPKLLLVLPQACSNKYEHGGMALADTRGDVDGFSNVNLCQREIELTSSEIELAGMIAGL